MARVWRSHKDSIHFGRTGKFFDRVEGEWDAILSRRFLRRRQVSSRERGDAALLRQRKTWHQPPDRMQPKAGDTKANHCAYFVNASARGTAFTKIVLLVALSDPLELIVS